MSLTERVRAFHEKHGFDVDRRLSSNDDHDVSMELHLIAAMLRAISIQLEYRDYEPRRLRTHLIIEEVAETIEGLANRDEVQVLDGIADAMYVLDGTGVAFGLPVEEAVVRVCDSNDTKAVRKPGDTRLRDKGPDYQPPNLAELL